MGENKPFRINLNGETDFELDRYNSALVRYLGSLAMHDHVQLATEYGAGYIFKDVDGFEDVSEYMEANQYPQAINCPEVPDHIIEAHAQTIKNISKSKDIDEEVENWRRMYE